jgi:hypothetical protein
MAQDAIFECGKCKQPFHADGLHIDVHGQAVTHICPECLASAESITILLNRTKPGEPYVLKYFEATKTE